jgi:hypothetical protein
MIVLFSGIYNPLPYIYRHAIDSYALQIWAQESPIAQIWHTITRKTTVARGRTSLIKTSLEDFHMKQVYFNRLCAIIVGKDDGDRKRGLE